MIDNHISDLNSESKDWNTEIAGLQELISEEESQEEPSESSIKSWQKQIEALESDVYSNEDKINYLEQDRSKIRDSRTVGAANRGYILDLVDKSIIEFNERLYFNTTELLKSSNNLTRSSFSSLTTSYRDVENNYSLLIDWAVAWDQAGASFVNAMPSSVIQFNLAETEFELFFSLIPKCEELIKGNKLTEQELAQITNLFPNSVYKGPAYQTQTGWKKRGEGESVIIEALDIESLWSDYFPYLDIPSVELVRIEEG